MRIWSPAAMAGSYGLATLPASWSAWAMALACSIVFRAAAQEAEGDIF
jgi:hypothetical protein